MSGFTTRPELRGTFGMVATTHWIASAVGMKMLEAGGNAYDAAAAAGLVLQVLEPHLNGPGGDLPIIHHSASTGRIEVICGQGTTPAGATIEHYRAQGLSLAPGAGLLATVVPGAFDAWMVMLRDHGTLPLRTILEPAIHYAENGHPMLASAAAIAGGLTDFFKTEWPTSFAVWCPGGEAPKPGALFANPTLAETWKRLLGEAEAKPGREAQIEAAREVFYRGFVAEAIDRFCRTQELDDGAGHKVGGVLNGDDLARWQATVEAPASYDYHGWTVHKTGPWGQGPVLLQCLALLRQTDVAGLDPLGADFVHLVAEVLKLAFADREIYYGDPDFHDVPLETLLSDAYNRDRAAKIGSSASFDFDPGAVAGYEEQRRLGLAVLDAHSVPAGAVYEPTMAHLARKKGDTVHLDVVDRWGNMVTATPSGGWLQSSPVIPELGFCLNSRAQMFWLEPGLPTSLEPNERPRTTLTPSLASFEGRPALAFGTPGGDQQDQWQLSFFLRHVHHGFNLQEAIDAPLFHSTHFPGSFYPRTRQPGQLAVEGNFGKRVIEDLERRGHDVMAMPRWSVGRLTAAGREADGMLKAAATPRLMQAYAVGR